MISRCPSCGAQVEEEATRCPSCHWDFEAHKRIPPGSAESKGPEPKEPGPSEEAGPPLGLSRLPKLDPSQIRRPSDRNPESPFTVPEIKPRAPEAKTPLPAPKPAPSAAERLQKPQAARTPGPPPKAPERGAKERPPRPTFTMAHFLGGAIALGFICLVAFYLTLRPEVQVGGTPGATGVFSKGSSGVKAAADKVQGLLGGGSQERPSPSQIQRVAIDPFHPQASPVVVPAETAEPALQAPQPERVSAPPPAPASLKAKAVWAFEGQVYDLINLQPVFTAILIFKDGKGTLRGSASTGGDGRYRIELPPLPKADAYTLTINHPDYLDKYLDEISPPFRELEADQRKILVDSGSVPQPWTGSTARATRRDFVLIPKAAKE